MKPAPVQEGVRPILKVKSETFAILDIVVLRGLADTPDNYVARQFHIEAALERGADAFEADEKEMGLQKEFRFALVAWIISLLNLVLATAAVTLESEIAANYPWGMTALSIIGLVMSGTSILLALLGLSSKIPSIKGLSVLALVFSGVDVAINVGTLLDDLRRNGVI